MILKKEKTKIQKYNVYGIGCTSTTLEYFRKIVDSDESLEAKTNINRPSFADAYDTVCEIKEDIKTGKRIDILIMDLVRYGSAKDGIKFIPEYRKMLPELPILVISKQNKKIRAEALKAGDFYKISSFPKFFTPIEIITKTIHDYLNGSTYALLWDDYY